MSTQEHDHIEPRITAEHQPDDQLWVRGPRNLATREFDDGRSITVAPSGTRLMVDFFDADGDRVGSAFYDMGELVGEAAVKLGLDD